MARPDVAFVEKPVYDVFAEKMLVEGLLNPIFGILEVLRIKLGKIVVPRDPENFLLHPKGVVSPLDVLGQALTLLVQSHENWVQATAAGLFWGTTQTGNGH